MADDHVQPDWLSKLPFDIVNLIGQRTRDPLTGLTTFRSVCRTWRVAVAPAPRLIHPCPQDIVADHMLVFPLSRGWCIVVDLLDLSCHLSHLATRCTAPLPNLNALSDGGDRPNITHISRSEIGQKATHLDVELSSLKEGTSCEDQDEQLTDQRAHEDRRCKIKTYFEGREICCTYIQFSDMFRFGIHVPASTQAGSTEGIVVMLYHSWLHKRTNIMDFCRPGDATWTMISDPNPEGQHFLGFAYFDGKVFIVNNKFVTLVFDTTLNILYQLDVPLEMTDFISKLSSDGGSHKFLRSLHLLALPHKLLLIKVFMGNQYSRKPVDLHVFELRDQGSNDQLAWCKVTGEGVGGNYELFMDSYDATFSNSGDVSGTRIYHAENEPFNHGHCVWGYCYNMQDNKLECIHEPPKDDHNEYSTKPTWFVP